MKSNHSSLIRNGLTLLALLTVLLFALPAASADTNLLENGSVQYVYVRSQEELAAYIDGNGAYSTTEWLAGKTYSNVYTIKVDEAGELLFCPLAPDQNSYANLQVFSDYGLTSLTGEKKAALNDREDMLRISVEPGTYYFRYYSEWNHAVQATTFIGFIPESGKMRTDTVTEAAAEKSNLVYDEVPFVRIADISAFVQAIDDELHYSSRDTVGKGEYSPVHQVTVDRSGTLLFCALAEETGCTISVFSDAVLSSRIVWADTQESTRGDVLAVHVTPGTYYYRFYSMFYTAQETAYVGFIPDDGETDRTFPEADAIDATNVEPFRIGSAEEFETILADGTGTFDSTMYKGEWSSVYAFSVKESGYLYIASEATVMSSYVHLYSNRERASCIYEESIPKEEKTKTRKTYLSPGTYYIAFYSQFYTGDQKTYLAFLPISDIISVASVETEKDHATVTFRIADDYDPDQYRAGVRVEKGVVPPKYLTNKAFWREESRINGIESHEFVATENGVYTARISGTGLDPYMLTFEVTGIEQAAAAAKTGTGAVTDKVHFREEPTKDSRALTKIDKKKQIVLYREVFNNAGERWWEAEFDGQRGFVLAAYVDVLEAPVAAAVPAEAKAETSAEPEATPEPDPAPEATAEPEPEPTAEPTPEPTPETREMTFPEMLNYMQALQQILQDYGIEMPEMDASVSVEECIRILEQTLRDNGIDF